MACRIHMDLGLSRGAARAPGQSNKWPVRRGRHYNTNMVPSGPEGDAANDVTVTRVTGTGGVPVCDIPAFGPPAA